MKTEIFDSHSLGSRLAAHVVRRLIAPGFSNRGDPKIPRRVLERLALVSRAPRRVEVREEEVCGLPAEWLIPEVDSEEGQLTILYLHGGGFVAGSRNTHREIAGRIAKASGARVLLPEYRLTPEHPHPAANEDCLAFYRWLLDNGTSPKRLIVGGDSAGGFLTIATLLALRDGGEPLPAGAFALSPATDLLHFDGPSVTERAPRDPWFGPEDLHFHGGRFFSGDPASPGEMCLLERDFEGLPPFLIQVGGCEVLFSDAERFAERADRAGVSVQLQVWTHLFHGFQHFAVLAREGRAAIKEIARFVTRTGK